MTTIFHTLIPPSTHPFCLFCSYDSATEFSIEFVVVDAWGQVVGPGGMDANNTDVSASASVGWMIGWLVGWVVGRLGARSGGWLGGCSMEVYRNIKVTMCVVTGSQNLTANVGGATTLTSVNGVIK